MPSGRAVALRYDGGDGAPVVVANLDKQIFTFPKTL